MLLSDYTGSARKIRKSKIDERLQALRHGYHRSTFFFLSFNSPSFCGIAANNLQEKTHQCVFQFIYLTSICLLLVYECISRRANFAQTYAISDDRGFILGGKGWGYVQPRAKYDPFRQTNKKYFRLSNLLIENSLSHNLKIKMHEKTHRACTVSIP